MQHIERLSYATCCVAFHMASRESLAVKIDSINHIHFSFILLVEPLTGVSLGFFSFCLCFVCCYFFLIQKDLTYVQTIFLEKQREDLKKTKTHT